LKNLYFFENGVAGAKPPTGTRGGSPSNIAPFRGKGFGDRDNKSEVYFKNRLFLQAENRLLNKAVLRIMQGDALDTGLILCYIIDTKRGKRQTVAP